MVSATESISEGAEGILLESMLEGMAEYYSAYLSEKVVRGMTENALKCKYNGGTLPIGYIIDSEQYFQPDPVTAPFILEAFKLYDEGAKNLLNICNKIASKTGKLPKVCCVICGLSNAAYQRLDNVYVIPITALKN